MSLPKIICSSDIPFKLDCLYTFLSKRSDLHLNGKFHLDELSSHLILRDFEILILDICEQTDRNVLKQIFQMYKEKKIMVLTRSDNRYFLSSLLHLGASGCFIKSASGEQFVSALHELSQNKAYLPEELSNKLFCELPSKYNQGVHRVIQKTHHEVPILNISYLIAREI